MMCELRKPLENLENSKILWVGGVSSALTEINNNKHELTNTIQAVILTPSDQKNLAQMPKGGKSKAPKEFMCLITRKIMEDPVIAADGLTYERLAIEQVHINVADIIPSRL